MRRIIALLLFAVSFAYIEASVVVYLRDILYPDGFSFPMRSLAPQRIIIEIGREFFSLFLIFSIALISSKGFWKVFSSFCLVFGVWDIFFYLWLKVTLDWPSSLFEWDLLFLIPAPWSGPVIAPIVVSITLIMIFILIELYKEIPFRLSVVQKTISLLGLLSIFISFIWNSSPVIKGEVPRFYPWHYLVLGETLLIYTLIVKLAEWKKARGI